MIFLGLSVISIIYFAVQLIIFVVYLFIGVSESIPIAVLVVILVFSAPIGLIGVALLGFGAFHLVLQCRYALLTPEERPLESLSRKRIGRRQTSTPKMTGRRLAHVLWTIAENSLLTT